ncbi:RES family NAD+ phosphorylase [Marinomonas arenicola]|uniref:RES family NAD+ phosphorylase n=1 Tax=Marinomonas arenicola TaxID=569601 RepID=UPI003C6F0F57
MDKAFSTPTKSSDLKSDYAPTRIISEFIKYRGYDGIAYRSSLGPGINIALFDLDVANIR